MLVIRETRENDLKNVQALWADGNVMHYVGFPDGLHESDESMRDWLAGIQESRPLVNHYSIYDDQTYCGEAYYCIDASTKKAAMDIKLFEFARGKGIAAVALQYAIQEAFKHGALIAWTDPNAENKAAIALYERLGMVRKNMPPELFNADYPDTLYFEIENS